MGTGSIDCESLFWRIWVNRRSNIENEEYWSSSDMQYASNTCRIWTIGNAAMEANMVHNKTSQAILGNVWLISLPVGCISAHNVDDARCERCLWHSLLCHSFAMQISRAATPARYEDIIARGDCCVLLRRREYSQEETCSHVYPKRLCPQGGISILLRTSICWDMRHTKGPCPLWEVQSEVFYGFGGGPRSQILHAVEVCPGKVL